MEKKDKGQTRAKILARIFSGDSKDFFEFQADNSDLKIGQLSRKYAEVKGLPLNEGKKGDKAQKQQENKLEKLSKFFNEPKENYTKIVEDNPNSRFIDLIDILRESGVEISKDKLQEFRKKERQAKVSAKEEKQELK